MNRDYLNQAMTVNRVYFAKFDKTIAFSIEHFNADPEADDLADYDQKCVETFLSWGAAICAKLEKATFDYYQEIDAMTDDGANELQINAPADVWRHCDPIDMRFERFAECSSDVFAIVSLECEWEPEHGLAWVVKNADELIFVGAQGNLHRITERQEHFNYAANLN